MKKVLAITTLFLPALAQAHPEELVGNPVVHRLFHLMTDSSFQMIIVLASMAGVYWLYNRK